MEERVQIGSRAPTGPLIMISILNKERPSLDVAIASALADCNGRLNTCRQNHGITLHDIEELCQDETICYCPSHDIFG
jgi:hypothetical protein